MEENATTNMNTEWINQDLKTESRHVGTKISWAQEARPAWATQWNSVQAEAGDTGM